MTPPVLTNDVQRLEALRALGIVDSTGDAFFQDITVLASRLLGAPVSAVSLVDKNSQWFEAATGLAMRETKPGNAFCAHAIECAEPLAVADATIDNRFAADPLVTGEPFLRSYAGAPLIPDTGRAFGTLCVFDCTPRTWTAAELATLDNLARITMRHIETWSRARRAAELESLHETVIATMAEGVVVHKSNGEVRLANPAALSILGLTLDQMMGKTSMDPAWRSEREDGTAFLGEDHPAMITLRSGQAVNDVVMSVARPDGSRKWIKINSRPIFGADPVKPVETVVTFSDITEERSARNQLHAKRQRLTMALELGAIGVIESDTTTGDVRTFGHTGTLDRFGPHPGPQDGSILDRLTQDRRPTIAKQWADHLAGGPSLRFEAPVFLADGTLRWALIGAEKLLDTQGRATGAMIAMKDIEDRKQAELTLMDSLRKLESASRAKDAFLANVGHEIRTPLNGVIGMAAALELSNLTDEQREMVSLIASSGEVLDRLLSDLLDMSKLDAGKVMLEPAPFDLCAAIVEASQLFEIRAANKGIGFSLDLARESYGQWTGDKVRIKQIVSNLVSNAIKFTAKGRVDVRLSATGAYGGSGLDWVTIDVEDTGAGIPENMYDKIFDRFEQVKSAQSAHEGTGLGLSICKSLVSLMGGEISVSSQPGQGSLFTVRLPLGRVADVSHRGQDSEPVEGKLLRVLLIDDHVTNQKVIEAMLRAFGCEIAVASDGASGLAAFQSGAFDLVLMDMSMPVMDGVTATRAIRAFERQAGAKRTPIAMLTAYGSDQHKRDAQDAGADFHIMKPVTPVTLLAGLEKAIRAAKDKAAA